MFAGRARPKKPTTAFQQQPSGILSPNPQVESNLSRKGSTVPEPYGYGDDMNSLPQPVIDAMSIVRISWDFMAQSEVIDIKSRLTSFR
jgi:hypothetical protein